MNTRRVKTVVRRHVYVLKRSPHRFFDVTVWPLLDVLLFGSLGAYVAQQDGASKAGAPYLLAGILMFHILYQLQIAICTGFMEETWSRNVLNILTTPVTEAEYILGVAAVRSGQAGAGDGGADGDGHRLLRLQPDVGGLGPACPITAVLLLAGWSIGMAVIGLMLRYGQSAEILAWGINFLVMALSGVFNPVDAIPGAAAAPLAHPAHHARLHARCARCSTASRCRGARSSPACVGAVICAATRRSGTPPACCGRSAGGASSPASRRRAARTMHGAAPLPHRASVASTRRWTSGRTPSAETSAADRQSWPLPSRCRPSRCCRCRPLSSAAVAVGRSPGPLLSPPPWSSVVAVVAVSWSPSWCWCRRGPGRGRRCRRRGRRRRRRRAVVGDRRAVVASSHRGRGRRPRRSRRGPDPAACRARPRRRSGRGSSVALDRRRRGVVGRVRGVVDRRRRGVVGSLDRRRGRRPSGVVLATVGSATDELVLVDASVELELVLDDGCAGISTRLSRRAAQHAGGGGGHAADDERGGHADGGELARVLGDGHRSDPFLTGRRQRSRHGCHRVLLPGQLVRTGRLAQRVQQGVQLGLVPGVAVVVVHRHCSRYIAEGSASALHPARPAASCSRRRPRWVSTRTEPSLRPITAATCGHVEVDDHPQQHGVGLVGGQQAHEGEGGAEVVEPLGRIVAGDRCRSRSARSPAARRDAGPAGAARRPAGAGRW